MAPRPDESQMLRNCSLVAKSWVYRSQKRLFETVRISTLTRNLWVDRISPANLELLHYTVPNAPRPLPHIHPRRGLAVSLPGVPHRFPRRLFTLVSQSWKPCPVFGGSPIGRFPTGRELLSLPAHPVIAILPGLLYTIRCTHRHYRLFPQPWRSPTPHTSLRDGLRTRPSPFTTTTRQV